MTCTRCHVTRELYRQDCGAHGLTVPCPSCALDELIAGDADLYDVRADPENNRLRTVLQWIADAGYVNHQSGNENFEYLQSVARDALKGVERTSPSDDVVDSGFTPENIADAEWLVANMPGNRKFHEMATYERALVCHTAARFRARAALSAIGVKP